jgi:zinc protease
MNRISRILICFFVFAIMIPSYINAQGDAGNDTDAKLEIDIDAKTLLNKHIEALGGHDAIAAIKDRSMEASMTMQAGPQTFEAEVSQVSAYPNKVHKLMVINIPGMQTTQEDWNNGTVASSNHGYGSKTLEGEDLARMLDDSQFNKVIRFDELGWSLKVSDKKIEDGRSVYYLEITKKYGTETWIIDAETSMMVGRGLGIIEQGKKVLMFKYSDFKEIDGVKLPHTTNFAFGSAKTEITVSSYRHNTSPPDSEFVE